jgi:hypothetical protein
MRTVHTVDYGCALQRDILLQGRLYVSEHHIAFHANIFGWITNVSLVAGFLLICSASPFYLSDSFDIAHPSSSLPLLTSEESTRR